MIAEAEAVSEEEWSMFIDDNYARIQDINLKFTDYVNYHMNQYITDNSFQSDLEDRNSAGYGYEKNQLPSDMVGRDLTISYPE